MCLSPITLKTPTAKKALSSVPCGRCVDCKKRRVSGWSFRLAQEARIARSAHFVTLTYDDESVPHSGAGYQTLHKPDLQKFFKRLRKRHEKQERKSSRTQGRSSRTLDVSHRIKYYACGEYGSRTSRPHYHVICFNSTPHDIEKAWAIRSVGLGNIHIGEVNGQTIGYTLKYISKPATVPFWEGDDREPEFSLMSKALGKGYLTPQMVNWHKADILNRMFCTAEGGIKLSMPRYYKDKIYTEYQRHRITQHLIEQQAQEEDPTGSEELSQKLGRIRKANAKEFVISKL